MMIKWQLVWLVLLVTPFLVHQFGQVECCLEEERLALLDLKAYMNSYSNQNLNFLTKSWSNPGEINCCKWSEVRCNVSSGRVTKLILDRKVWRDDEDAMKKPWLFNVTLFRPFSQLIYLDLSSNFINGLVEDHGSTNISTLKNLRVLMLDDNDLGSGHISVSDLTSLRKLGLSGASLNEYSFPLYQGTWLCRLRNLQKLDLSDNNFMGGIPPCISNLTSLQTLDLSRNDFSKELPDLSNLWKLRVLDLGSNHFSSDIQGICKLTNLLELNIKNNLFNGVVPLCLQNSSSLQYLDLSINHFNGKFPIAISHLSHLRYLDLSDNYFEGELSFTSLANLSKLLQVLKLSRNKLEVRLGDSLSWQPTFQLQTLHLQGCKLNKTFTAFPEFLSHQTNLSNLDLSDNILYGAFPTWLFNNSKIEVLYLANNYLTGSIQLPSFVNSSLLFFDISNNSFHDNIPKNIGLVFSKLQYFNVSGNNFKGHIPSSIAQMRGLIYLDLSSNNFSGKLPRRFLSDLPSLEVLDLSDNNIKGDIIPKKMYLPSLIWLKLSNNRFGGKINEALQNSSILLYLELSNNNITGELPWWVGNSFALHTLRVSQNKLEGQIPKELCKFAGSYLDLSLNNFSGPIPSCPEQLCLSGTYMHLNGNSLTGEIPNSLSSCSSLEILDLSDNQLSGNIPLWIDKLLSLTVLLLAGNNLRGPIPQQLCHLGNINYLDLSRNNLHGGIPVCFGNMSFGLVATMKIDNNSIFTEGELGQVAEVGLYDSIEKVEYLSKNQHLTYMGRILTLMSGLDLSCNKLSGKIPTQMGDLKYIQSLNLSQNFLSGPIPDSFSYLKQIESLDLCFNNLSGNIPSQLVELNFLAIFNVSYNNLSGRVPATGQFGGFDKSNYLGNPQLSGFPGSDLHNQTQALTPSSLTKDGGDGDHDETFVEDFLWSFGMSCATIFLATIAILHINPRWRQACFDFVDWYVLWWLPMSWRSLY